MTSQLRGAALVGVWSSGFIGAELGARHAGPDTVLAWRGLLTVLVLLPWLLPALRLGRAEWVRQGVVALLCQCLYLGGVFWAASAGVPAGTSALIASLQPALVLLLSGLRLRAGHLAGLVLGTLGVALTALSDLRAGVTVLALLLPLAAMLSLTIGTLLQQRWTSPPLMQTLAMQALFTAGFFTVYAAAAGNLSPPTGTGFWVAVTWAAAAGIASYGLYYLVTAVDGAARASTLLYLTPAATALWAAPMFGQPIRWLTILGLLISASAVVLLRNAAPTPTVSPTEPPAKPPPEWPAEAPADPPAEPPTDPSAEPLADPPAKALADPPAKALADPPAEPPTDSLAEPPAVASPDERRHLLDRRGQR